MEAMFFQRVVMKWALRICTYWAYIFVGLAPSNHSGFHTPIGRPFLTTHFKLHLSCCTILLSWWYLWLTEITWYIYVFACYVLCSHPIKYRILIMNFYYEDIKCIYILKNLAALRYNSHNHIIHPFKVYNPVVLSVFKELCNHHYNQF